MFSKEVGIDLGTANILMYVKGEGIVIDEPSLLVVRGDASREVLAVGEDARPLVDECHVRPFGCAPPRLCPTARVLRLPMADCSICAAGHASDRPKCQGKDHGSPTRFAASVRRRRCGEAAEKLFNLVAAPHDDRFFRIVAADLLEALSMRARAAFPNQP